MMLEKINPKNIAEPFNNAYHHTVVIPAGSKVAHISGQVGLKKDGTVSDDLREQVEQTWQNLMACVEVAGMGAKDIVKVTAYLVNAEDYPVFAEVRAKYLPQARPAATTILVKSLVMPEWRVEIEAVIAKFPPG